MPLTHHTQNQSREPLVRAPVDRFKNTFPECGPEAMLPEAGQARNGTPEKISSHSNGNWYYMWFCTRVQ
jgi:hypothetical protein